MSLRFPNGAFARDKTFNREKLDAVITSLDRAIHAIELTKIDWLQQVTLFQTNALKRVADAVQPIVDQLRTAVEGGFLVAATDDLVALVEGEEVSFFIPESARVAYRPTPFLAILSPDEHEDWAIGRLLGYNDVTGLLTVEILYLNGSGAERTGWTVAASSGVTEAVYGWMNETKAARDATISAASQAISSIGDLGAEIISDAGAARDTAVAAAEATNAAAILIAGGPVSSVNGRNGVVTGLAEAADVASAVAALNSAIALKANASATTTALAAKADTATTYTKTEVDAAVSAAKLQIGDILYSLRNPGSSYLALNGSTYLISAYTSLIAAIGHTVPTWAGQKIADPAILPPSSGSDVAWSPDGRYMAVVHSTSPFLTIYDWQTGTPVKIANPAVLPTGNGAKVAWSPSGRYLAVLHTSSPCITIYDWQTGSPVKIANPAALPVSTGYGGLAWSPDSRYLAVAHDSGICLTIYDFQSGSPVKIANPAVMPPGNGVSAAWSPSGRYLVIGHYIAPFATVYDWISGSPVKMADPTTWVGSITWRASWSPNGRYLAVGTQSYPYLEIYDWNSGSPVKLANPAALPTSIVYGITWSPDGRYMTTAHASGDFQTTYDWATGAPVKMLTLPTLAGSGSGVAWRPTLLRHLAFAHGTSPYVTIWDGYYALGYDPNFEFKLPTSTNGWIRKS